jgi:tRNA G18 (ribose-2'-O)-methylase SpoU
MAVDVMAHYDFTKRKFQTLTLESQHKKCADLLRRIYDKLLQQEECEQDQQAYQELLHWMNDSFTDRWDAKAIADRYHWHRQQARLSKKEHHLLPSIRTGDRLEGEAPWSLAIYLDHLRSAHNVGSIVRTVEAFALGNMYFSDQTPFITHKQVQDTAMGAHKWVACYQHVKLTDLPRPFIALETSAEAVSLYDFIFPDSFTLIVGNEEYGCSDEVLQLADYLIEIPLRGRKNSLNVSNAFAIAAGEINRQKRLTF